MRKPIVYIRSEPLHHHIIIAPYFQQAMRLVIIFFCSIFIVRFMPLSPTHYCKTLNAEASKCERRHRQQYNKHMRE